VHRQLLYSDICALDRRLFVHGRSPRQLRVSPKTFVPVSMIRTALRRFACPASCVSRQEHLCPWASRRTRENMSKTPVCPVGNIYARGHEAPARLWLGSPPMAGQSPDNRSNSVGGAASHIQFKQKHLMEAHCESWMWHSH